MFNLVCVVDEVTPLHTIAHRPTAGADAELTHEFESARDSPIVLLGEARRLYLQFLEHRRSRTGRGGVAREDFRVRGPEGLGVRLGRPYG